MSPMIRTNSLRYYLKMEKAEMKIISRRMSLLGTRCWIRQLVAFLFSLYLLTGPLITSTFSIDYVNPILENPSKQFAGDNPTVSVRTM